MRTRAYPVNLDQQLRVFVAAADYWRAVSLELPESPRVNIAIDEGSNELGFNRDYKTTPLSPGQSRTIRLAPGQFISGHASVGMARVGIIEEACDAPRAR